MRHTLRSFFIFILRQAFSKVAYAVLYNMILLSQHPERCDIWHAQSCLLESLQKE